jgi:hypothetical protein
MDILVLDGQGGGLGKTVISKLREELGAALFITALGTNSYAAKAMLKSGADKALFGEDTIVSFLNNSLMDCIIAPIGCLCNGGLNGEITEKISHAIFTKECTKYLIPLRKHGFYIPGSTNLELKEIIQEIADQIKKCQE